MAYLVKEPEVQVLLQIGEIVDTDGKHIAYEHASQTFLKDEVIEEDPAKAKAAGQLGPISPAVIRSYEDGDTHTCTVLEKVATPAKTRGRAKAGSDSDDSASE